MLKCRYVAGFQSALRRRVNMPANAKALARATPSIRQVSPSRTRAVGGLCGCSRSQRRDHLGVSRETAINDDGSVFTRELDHDLLQHDAAATNATCAPRPARAEAPFDRRPGYVRLSGGASFADVSTVAL